MTFALIAVNSPADDKRAFSYLVPNGLKVQEGQAVWVPFGKRILQGIILELNRQAPDNIALENIKNIDSVIENAPMLSAVSLSVARFMADYYMAPLFPAVSCFLPPAFTLSPRNLYQITSGTTVPQTEQQRKLFNYIKEASPTNRMLKNHFAKDNNKTLETLLQDGKVHKVYSLSLPKVQIKTADVFSLIISYDEVMQILQSLRKNAIKKRKALELLLAKPQINAAESVGIRLQLNDFIRKGWVQKKQERILRDVYIPYCADKIHQLSTAQQQAAQAISDSLKQNQSRGFLLHGVTGSGKTEVYLQCAQTALEQNKSVIVLLPEIVLCPQTIARFNARFPGQVAILHSELALGQRFDQWQQIASGHYKIVIGARSAIFAPVQNLGLVIIDEEHETSYKQQDFQPFYHVRTVAQYLCRLSQATLVLGSATPSLESYNAAQKGIIKLLVLPDRPATHMPQVHIVDMRKELKTNKRAVISLALQEAINQTLNSGKQVLVMHNRRGEAHFSQCPLCGYIPICKNCNVPLAVHENSFLCHRCNKEYKMINKCRKCDHNLKTRGYGTENIYSALQKLFPTARLLRWDKDSAKQYGQNYLYEQAQKNADIIIGTQMVSKGLDLENIALSAVILAETGEGLPDFRSYEKIFELCCQTAGRAGRQNNGRVVIQTYNLGSYPVVAAAAHNYELFFKEEIAF
ncbi:MAG: primosomal protein N', partial [Chloroflexi bacterium]|nr:primosomal protein N' [Chloroflexota bacterium]